MSGLVTVPDNSVLPAWRRAITQLQVITNWDSAAPRNNMEAAQRRMTEEFVPKIEAVTPGSGSYMNEADFRQERWEDVFFGRNFKRLEDAKVKYDPEDVFYVLKEVGSGKWRVDEDGRMCRVDQ